MARLTSRRVRRLIGLLIPTVAFVVLVTVVLYSVQQRARQQHESEQYVVWSAYLNQTSGDSLPGLRFLTVIEDSTMSFNLLGSVFSLFSASSPTKTKPSMVSKGAIRAFHLLNLRSTPIRRKFQLAGEYQLASLWDYESTQFVQKYPDNYGLIRLSSVGFNGNQTVAYFYIEHICGLCGGGRYVLMRKTNGKWTTVDEYWAWIS